jgi:hypothetical protein
VSPKIKVVLGFVCCLATAGAIVWTLPSIAVHFGMRLPTFHGSQGENFLILVMMAPILTFIVGAVLMRRTFRAATKTNGGAFILTGAFATFPIWFVPMAASAFFSGIRQLHPPPVPKVADISLKLEDATYTDDGTSATIKMRLHPLVGSRGVATFELVTDAPFHGWSIDSPRGRVTGVRGETSFVYHDSDSHEPVPKTDNQSIIMTLVLRRQTPDVKQLPSQIRIFIFQNPQDRPHETYGEQIVSFPWAQASASR